MQPDAKNIFPSIVEIYGDIRRENCFIQPVDEHDLGLMESEFEEIKKLHGSEDFCVAAVAVSDWNSDLTPWCAPPVFGNDPFGDKAPETLKFILYDLIPLIEKNYPSAGRKFYVCGYSLAGLFALWASFQTDRFEGVAAVSPSLWYEGWTQYAEEHFTKAKRVYLSLGEKEEKAKNKIMAAVGDALRHQYELLKAQGADCVLEWNPGNHFADSDMRTAKGMAWLLAGKKRSFGARSDLELEKLSDGDVQIARMSKLASDIVKEYYDPILGSDQNDYMIKMFQSEDAIKGQLRHGYNYYFARSEGKDVGFFAFYKRDDELYLSKLYLKKDSRGKGFSKMILGFLVSQAKQMKVRRITLNVNKYNRSVDVYKKLGFEIVRSEKNDIGHGYYMDDYVMSYDI